MKANTKTAGKTAKKTRGRKLDKLDGNAIIGLMRRGRRGNHHGTLVMRGKGRNIIARFVYKGKVHQYSTHTTDVGEAYRVLDELTWALRRDSLADSLNAIKTQILEAEGKRERMELAIDRLWEVFSVDGWNGTEKASTISVHKAGFDKMVGWMKAHGVKTASQITNDLAGQFDRYERADLGAVTYNNRLVFLKRVWAHIKGKGQYELPQVWEGFDKIKGVGKATNRRPLTDSEIDGLLSKADADTKLLIQIGLYTGMRKGDCACLKWADVDMDEKRLSVTPIKTSGHGIKLNLKLTDELYEALAEAKARSNGEYVNERNAREYKARSIDRRIKNLFKACGIETVETDANGKRKVATGFHALRHTAASKLLTQGVAPTVVKEIMGWKSLDMMNVYGHTAQGQIDAAMDKLAAA